MNKKSYLYFLLFFLIVASGCVNDDTNTQFKELNEVCIDGISDKYENVYIDKEFSITPTISTTENDETALEYVWLCYNRNTLKSLDTLAVSKDLNIKVALTPGDHYLLFKVYDTQTGVYYSKQTTLTVVNEFSSGLLILTDNQGQAELDFWVPGRNVLVQDLYAKLNNGGSLGQNPRKLAFNKYSTDLSSEVMVMCEDEQGGKVLESQTMTFTHTYKDFFVNGSIEQLHPQAYFRSDMREYLIDGGQVYDRAINSNPPSQQVKPAMTSQKGDYEIAADADFGDDAKTVSRMVLYDNKNTCFYCLYSITSAFLTTVKNTSGITYISGGAFNPDNVGLRCLFAHLSSRSDTDAREYIGVFEDSSRQRYLLKMGIGFWVTGASPNRYFKDIAKKKMDVAGIQDATTFTCSASFSGYLFYAAVNSIYAYNTTNYTGSEILNLNLSLGGSYAVDLIEIERNSSRLWIGFRDLSAAEKPAGIVGFNIQTDGGLQLSQFVRYDHVADRIIDFESKY